MNLKKTVLICIIILSIFIYFRNRILPDEKSIVKTKSDLTQSKSAYPTSHNINPTVMTNLTTQRNLSTTQPASIPTEQQIIDPSVLKSKKEWHQKRIKSIQAYINEKKTYSIGTHTYHVLQDVHAIPEKGRLPAHARVILKENGFIYFFSDDKADDKRQPVLCDSTTNQLYTVSGLIIITPIAGFPPEKISTTFKIKLIQSFPNLNLYYYNSENWTVETLIAVVSQIQNSKLVKNVRLELINKRATAL